MRSVHRRGVRTPVGGPSRSKPCELRGRRGPSRTACLSPSRSRGLAERGDGASTHGFDCGRDRGVRRRQDHRGAGRRRTEALDHLEAADARQADIHDRHVGAVRPRPGEGHLLPHGPRSWRRRVARGRRTWTRPGSSRPRQSGSTVARSRSTRSAGRTSEEATVVPLMIDTLHVDELPEEAPLQPTNDFPSGGVTVKVTVVP